MVESTLLNNRYRLDERLGSGGMAVVYRAHDLMLERTVAIKILRQNFSQDPAFRERFRQEAKAAANLAHPNIVTVHDFGIADGFPFIVMEHVAGPHLKEVIRSRGRLPVEEAVALMVQACDGVGYAHRAGVVHCDLKPHNMLVTEDQRLKVTDFGIARALASIHPEEQSDVVWGSPQYFAPEQAAGGPPSPSSDVYSLGVVLYEMLTGQLPFQAESAEALARLHQSAPPPPLRRVIPSIAPALEEIQMKVLAKEPASRYRTADQFGRILANLHLPTAATAVSPAARQPAAPVYTSPPAGSAARPAPGPTRISPVALPTAQSAAQPESNPLDLDWLSLGLGLLAVLAVGGLLPFWLWIYLTFNPPVP